MLEQHVVGLLKEADRLGVFPAAVLIRQPFPIGTQVVAIKHRCHRIHTNSIDVELLEPKDQICNKEIANLIAAVVEDQGAPFLVFPDPWIAVFVKVRTIEESQAMGILREMAWNPIDDHPDPFGVASIHEGPKFIRRSVAAGGGVPTCHLIPPRPIEGVLGDRHHLDVGESPLLYIRNQAIGKLGIGEKTSTGLHVRRRNRFARGPVGLNPRLVR